MKHSEKINKILFKIYPNSGINKTTFSSSELRELFNANHITNSSDYHDNRVYLTDKGKAYVETLKSETKRYNKEIRRSWIQFWIPVVISIIALIGAYRQELASLLQVLAKLLK